MKKFLLIFLLVANLAIAQSPGEPVPKKELSEFLGPVSPKAISWTKVMGPGFGLYYGQPNPPLAGSITFYLGGTPNVETDPTSEIVDGTIGAFPVQWHRTTASDGSIKQHGAMSLDEVDIYIWVNGKQQTEVDRLLGVVAKLPMFVKKVAPVSTK